MSGERDLSAILGSLTVTRRTGTYLYLTGDLPEGAKPVAMVTETEGTTWVIERPADTSALGAGALEFEAAWLTLEVHTALDGVGLTAAVSAVLADAGIACNLLAGFYHDHLLVPAGRANDAIEMINSLRSTRRNR